MVSVWHLVIVLIIVVFVMGPSRFEQFGPSIGRAIRGFRKGLNGEDDEEEKKKKEEAEKNKPST